MFNLDNDLDDAVKYYPSLKVSQKGNLKQIVGLIDIKSPKTSEVLDQYMVEIIYPKEYPKRLPIVRELSNKIPKVADRHVYRNGNLCLMAPPEEVLLCIKKNGKINTIYFIQYILIPYLANQTLINVGEKGFLRGERSHEFDGILEFWKELCKTDDIEVVILCMEIAITNNPPPRREKCFCSKNQSYMNCHSKVIQELKVYPLIYLMRQYAEVKKRQNAQ